MLRERPLLHPVSGVGDGRQTQHPFVVAGSIIDVEEISMAIPESRIGNIEQQVARPVFNVLDWLATLLLVIGGLNWGSIGVFDTNLVALLVGDMTPAARVIYTLVGLAALYKLYLAARVNRRRVM